MTSRLPDTDLFSLSNLQSILDYIEENLLEELTPADIAAHFFVSVSAVSNLFKIVCGLTIMEYVRNRRLTLAAEELSSSNTSIIDLACKYGYDTPEAFTKAFSRLHGFPPSFVRRGFPVSKAFLPLRISVAVQGGWTCTDLTKSSRAGQDASSRSCYNTPVTEEKFFMETELSGEKGGSQMDSDNVCRIDLSKMLYQKEWEILYALAEELLQSRIPFKVDGKTMIFAHGLEFPLEQICLTFKWGDEETVKSFFHHDSAARHTGYGFKYFDARYRGMRVRCMFYGNCTGEDMEGGQGLSMEKGHSMEEKLSMEKKHSTDEFLYRNTDLVQIRNLLIPVQSLKFYYENAEKETPYYKMVAERLGKQENLGKHENCHLQNKKAWEYSAYEFWLQNSGLPADRAKKSLENPLGILKRYACYFDHYAGVRIANICGSCGKKAIPLAILGAEVTVFDISEDNRRYAMEVAEAAGVTLHYEVCDVLEIDREKYGSYFDVVFMEGGILHYFHDINEFMHIMHALLKNNGKMICSDFHPFTKISDILVLQQPSVGYFSTDVFEGEMAHARFYPDAVRNQMPKCLYRKYTVSEIINAILKCGFLLEKFDEHPAWTNDSLPGEFTAVASKRTRHA